MCVGYTRVCPCVEARGCVCLDTLHLFIEAGSFTVLELARVSELQGSTHPSSMSQYWRLQTWPIICGYFKTTKQQRLTTVNYQDDKTVWTHMQFPTHELWSREWKQGIMSTVHPQHTQVWSANHVEISSLHMWLTSVPLSTWYPFY